MENRIPFIFPLQKKFLNSLICFKHRDIFHLPVYSLSKCFQKLGWGQAKVGSLDLIMCVSHLGGRNPRTEYALVGCWNQKPGQDSDTPIQDVVIPSNGLSTAPNTHPIWNY